MPLTKVSYSMVKDAPINVKDFGAVGDGITDDTAAIQAAFVVIYNSYGGTIYFPPGTYLVSSTVGTANAPFTIRVLAYGATLKRAPTTDPYNMFVPSSNWTIEGLSLLGYVQSGTDSGNVVPQSGYGFRMDISQKNVTFIQCNVDNISFDGWFISGTTQDIYLQNCTGSLSQECYRNTVTVGPTGATANVQNVIISGGKFGPAKGRPAIDLEPDSGGVLGYVFIGNGVHVTGGIDVIAGPIQNVQIDGVVFDGPGSTFLTNFTQKLQLANLSFINGAYFRSTGVDQGPSGSSVSFVDSADIEIGSISGLSSYGDAYIGPNVIQGSNNTFANWSYFANPGVSGTIAITPNMGGVGPTKALLIDAFNYAAEFVQLVEVTSGNYYTFGAYMVNETGNSSIVLTEKDVGGNPITFRTFRGNSETGRVIAILKVDPATTHIEINFGSHTTSGANKAYFGAMFLRRGVVNDWVPSQRETFGPTWEAAPTTGTWAQGDVVIDNTPSSGGNIGWVCTTAGTPGTWKTFGTIS